MDSFSSPTVKRASWRLLSCRSTVLRMAIAYDICMRICTRNTRTHNSESTSTTLPGQLRRTNTTLPSKECEMSILVLLNGWNCMRRRNIGASITLLAMAMAISYRILLSVNAWLLDAREKPILAMLGQIRHQLMDWFAKRRLLDTNVEGILVSSVAA